MFRKLVISLLTAVFLFTQNLGVSLVLAFPDLPDAPDGTQETEAPEEPDRPETEITESAEEEDEGAEEVIEDTYDVPEAPEAGVNDDDSSNTGDQIEEGGVGDVEIQTGEAEATGAISNIGNTNLTASDPYGEIGGIDITNQDNGTESENSGSVTLEEDSTTVQDNSASLDNSLEVEANSGRNSASRNVGDSSIETGDANVSGTIMNSVNTNIAGATVSEFNVVDDQVGDLILDYESYCITNCGVWGGVDLTNEGNGSGSENTLEVELISNDLTFQNNDATVENELILVANSGENKANDNTGGDSTIKTGDANVSGNVLNFLNNNFAGEVVYGVVNIFGELVGDIVVPDQYAGVYSGYDVNLANLENGSKSTNAGEVLLSSNEAFNQLNSAEILNSLYVDANTGGNTVSDNTGGDNYIATGDVDIDAQILNIANNNVVGGDWWIVLVNEAGNWIGRIFAPIGAFNGSNFAASQGSTAQVADSGEITITNQGNGTDSENSGTVSRVENSELNQTNTADLINNISLVANTGDNEASRNTGGTSKIETGDANIQFNLVNFLNNNFAGGNVFLTVVNVFGSWIGDFLTPGSAKAEDPVPPWSESGGVGGSTSLPSSSSQSPSSNSNGSVNTSSTSSGDSSQVLTSASRPVLPKAGVGGKIASGAQTEREDLALADFSKKITENADSKAKVNLAWTVLLVPGYLVLRFVRRRLLA